MWSLRLPSFDIKLGGDAEHPLVFDALRRRYVALTPEEWVRQHFVHYLVRQLGYPITLMGNEVPLQCGEKRLRADTVVFGHRAQPIAIVEYKAPDVPITSKVFEQISAYNTLLHVHCLMVSNGLEHYCCRKREGEISFSFVPHLPHYKELLTW